MKNTSELEFEDIVIDYLTKIGGVKQWVYAPNIRTVDHLWSNFKTIVESNNRGRLRRVLSDTEFNQIKKIISDLRSPFEAGKFLYGLNGVAEVDITTDEGKSLLLTIFDQDQVGAGDTSYQIVNQIQKDSVIEGRKDRRFDVTLLINGLPIIQIELKKAFVNARDSIHQFKNYISDKQYSGVFSTLQVLVAMSPYEVLYMANATREQFNPAFAFQWQDEKTAEPVRDWKQFSDQVLSIPMAHELATRFMILDGTKNKESIKVMRPYQVHATKNVLEKISKYRFEPTENKLGYIWHTTGSGKTITSFKTAWLASRMPNVDKVIFLVDRVALTNQTVDAYKAYDPVSGSSGVVEDTSSVRDLAKKFNSKTDKNIIVTSIQKMSMLVEHKNFDPKDQNIIFIVDEAHRSTGSVNDNGMLDRIKKKIITAGWVGYTGTPNFEQNSTSRTEYIFGSLLHAYTIKEAISDRNVLGFKVEFKETIEASPDIPFSEISEEVKATVYDTSAEHVEMVVEDILKNWNSRSSNRRYNAILTVNVGGQETSIPRVLQYYREFQKQNNRLPESERITVGASFSYINSNTHYQVDSNEGLELIMKDYAEMFGKKFDLKTVKDYTEDLTSRINKTAVDRKYLDLVIVINQFLTGFDAPDLNTLYIDRTLKGSGLIQAYSRTNRIRDNEYKPWGNIVNYRWPKQNEIEMNQAFQIYSDRSSASEQMSLEDLIAANVETGLLAKPYKELIEDIREVIMDIKHLTNDIEQVPRSEREREELLVKLKQYSGIMNKLKQYPIDDGIGFPKDDIESFYEDIGITAEQENSLLSALTFELRELIAKKENIDISQVNLLLEHVQEVYVNYDYLIDLIAKMADFVHEGNEKDANSLMRDFDIEISKVSSDKEKKRFREFVRKILSGEYKFKLYPTTREFNDIVQSMEYSEYVENKYKINTFIDRFGLEEVTDYNEINRIISRHRTGYQDLDKKKEITNLMNEGKKYYEDLAVEEVSDLSWISYRRTFRDEIYKLADEVKEND